MSNEIAADRWAFELMLNSFGNEIAQSTQQLVLQDGQLPKERVVALKGEWL